MPEDILGMYGADSSQPQRAAATNGGKITPKSPDYHPPTGPSGINDPKTPGLHGSNHGNCGTQGKR